MISIVLSGLFTATSSGAASTGAPITSPIVIDLSEYSVPATTVLGTMHRVSLDPGSIAAAGVSLNDSVEMLTAAAISLEEHVTALAAADDAVGASRASVDSLERSIRAGQVPDTHAAVASLDAARAAYSSAIATRNAVLASIIEAATADLSNDQKSALATIRASSVSWSELPAAYRVIASDDASLFALRGALAAKRIAIATQEAIPEDAAEILGQWAQSQAIASALVAQDANAAMISASWATAIMNPPNP